MDVGVDELMKRNYGDFKSIIQCMPNSNINVILNSFINIINQEEYVIIISCVDKKKEKFWHIFDTLENPKKYSVLCSATEVICPWIKQWLGPDNHYFKKMFSILFEWNNSELSYYLRKLDITEVFFYNCATENIITIVDRDRFIALFNSNGCESAKIQFIMELPLISDSALAYVLWFLYKQNPELFEEDLPDIAKVLNNNESDELKKKAIKWYIQGIVEKEIKRENEKEALDSNGNSDENCIDDNNSFDLSNLNECLNDLSNKSSSQLLEFIPQSDQPNFNNSASNTFQTREYQEELAREGLKGENVLICAPTGCGKTVVAIKLINEIAKSKKNPKIAFIVPTNILADQQYNVLQKSVDSLKLGKFNGDVSKNLRIDVLECLEIFELFVMTPKILSGNLNKDGNSNKIIQFDLIIFDECHHCDKNHDYNAIMDHYFISKNRQLASGQLVVLKLPQIVGLTASIDTKQAKNKEEALNALMSLCANLDAHSVCSVKDNIEELRRIVPIAEKDIIKLDRREIDEFKVNLESLMEKIEKNLVEIFSSINISLNIPTNRFQDIYLNFLGNLLNDDELWRKGILGVITLFKIYLEKCYRALIINTLFNYTDAIEYLQTLVENSDKEMLEEEIVIRNYVTEFLSLTTYKQSENATLKRLKDEVTQQLTDYPDSRIVVFVKEVEYANILDKIFKKNKNNKIKCSILVGQKKRNGKGGLSKSETETVVARFRSGELNLLFCTSVAEEGLDIEKCQLVIRYGHVTNEISSTQTRGRARYPNSRYLILVPFGLEWLYMKEHINECRGQFMYQAIKSFQELNPSERNERIKQIQENRINIHEKKSSPNTTSINHNSDIPSSNYRIFCKCNNFICDSNDIRIINETSRIMVNKNNFDNLQRPDISVNDDNNNIEVLCKCGIPLGSVVKIRDYIHLPSLNKGNLRYEEDNQKKRLKKWDEAPFHSQQIKTFNLKDSFL